MKNQKFHGGDTPGPPSIARASGPRIQASPEKSPHLSNQQPQLQFASYGTEFTEFSLSYPAICSFFQVFKACITMGYHCCVVGCSLRGKGHLWPLDKQLAKMWMKAVPRKWTTKPLDKRANGKLYRPFVCRDHFTEDDFVQRGYYSEYLCCHFY